MSSSLGAGLPASGESVMVRAALHRTGLRAPDVGGVLRDRAVARELARARHVENALARPGVWLTVESEQPRNRLEIGLEVGERGVKIALCEQRAPQRLEHPGLVAAEIIGKDQVERRACLGLMVVMPVRAVPAA